MEPIVITPDTVKYWSHYANNRNFTSVQEAQDWIFHILEINDGKGISSVKKGPEYNRAYANQIPIYQAGKSWKIGKPIRNRSNVFRLSDVEIRLPDKEMLYNVARGNVSGEYEMTKLIWVPIREVLPDTTNDMYSFGGEAERIKGLAQQIKQNKWLEAVIVGIEPTGKWLIEGQHRARAMQLLGFARIPAIGIIYDDNANAVKAWVKKNCKFSSFIG